MFLTGSFSDCIRQLSTCKLLSQIKFATRPYLVHIWRMDPEIKMQKSVSNRILSGFYKAVVDLQIVKVRVHLLPVPTGISLWHMDPEYKMHNGYYPHLPIDCDALMPALDPILENPLQSVFGIAIRAIFDFSMTSSRVL